MEPEVLPILAITTDSCRDVLAFWQQSLDGLHYPSSQRHISHLGELDPPRGYCTASWTASASSGSGSRWLREVANHVASHQGQRFICAGPGVQFLPSFVEVQSRWKNQMDDGQLDLLFLAERRGPMRELRPGEVCTLFFLVDCNRRSLEFWTQALARHLAEPPMAGHQPREAQFHVNSLLMFRAGSGPQDGDCGVRWDFVPNEDALWTEAVADHNVGAASFHVATGGNQAAQLSQVLNQMLHPRSKAVSKAAAAAAKAEEQMLQEVDQITAEIARLRKELIYAPRDELDRHRASLELAAAELMHEVHRLAGDFAPCPSKPTPLKSAPEVLEFEVVD